MAIQLNDRDHLIFKLIDEHQVLLEKHISWFISGDDKPVLIRDRLRKLFYLDYLLCHRHGTKLPWWTTPTKPLVYMLSPMSRTISGAILGEQDLFDSEIQRHFLEVANLRMLFLMGQKDGNISDLDWTTCKSDCGPGKQIDAKVTLKTSSGTHKLAIINQPTCDAATIVNLDAALKEGCDNILVVCRDDLHQQSLQKILSAHGGLAKKCLFATHHELYKDGIVGTRWMSCDHKASNPFEAAAAAPAWTGNFVAVSA